MSTRPLRTNFFVNLLSPFARIAIALVTIPIYIHHLWYSRYGVLTIAWILVGYFGFLDLGTFARLDQRLGEASRGSTGGPSPGSADDPHS